MIMAAGKTAGGPERRAFANTTGKEVAMRPSDGMDEIRITAPVPGTCPVCATKHDERNPHDRDSLYYQNQFFKANKRFPSWWDAMSHCTDMTKATWVEKLKKRGIVLEAPAKGGQDGQ